MPQWGELLWFTSQPKVTLGQKASLDFMDPGFVIQCASSLLVYVHLSEFKKKKMEMSGKAELMAFECQEWHLPVGTAEAFSAGNVPRLWQHWQHSKGLLSKQNARSTVGDPDSWYVTLWLTWNHKSSDHFPSLYNFSIQLHLFFIWRNTIVHPFFFSSVKTWHPRRPCGEVSITGMVLLWLPQHTVSDLLSWKRKTPDTGVMAPEITSNVTKLKALSVTG